VAGGQYVRQVDNDSQRILKLEQFGSPAMIAHDQLDRSETDELRRRVLRLEDAIVVIADVKGQLGSINARLDTIADWLRRSDIKIIAPSK